MSPQPVQPAPSYPVGEPANAKRRYEVTASDLPLACPLPEMTLWNSHPRIFLPIIDDGGTTVCPYCGAEYVLKDVPGAKPTQDWVAQSA